MTEPKIGIHFGALAPPLGEQLRKQSMTMDEKTIAALEADIKAASRLYLRGHLTESEVKRARKRIMQQITGHQEDGVSEDE